MDRSCLQRLNKVREGLAYVAKTGHRACIHPQFLGKSRGGSLEKVPKADWSRVVWAFSLVIGCPTVSDKFPADRGEALARAEAWRSIRCQNRWVRRRDMP